MVARELNNDSGKERLPSAMPTPEEIEEGIRDIHAKYQGDELITRMVRFTIFTVEEALFAQQSVKATKKNLETPLGTIAFLEGETADTDDET